jgi:hypothetical protein
MMQKNNLLIVPAKAWGRGALRFQRPAVARASQTVVHIAALTGPLAALAGRKVLVLADVENLSYGARDLGYKISYRTLADRLRAASRACALHAFFSREAGDEARAHYFEARGWVAHQRDIQVVRTCRGAERLSNSDNLILFTAGVLVSRSDAEAVVVASGDGTLVCELAAAIRALPRRRQVITLSLAGSTSWRLDAAKNPDIAANIEIGRDCLFRPSK